MMQESYDAHMNRPIIYFNIGWMKDYNGESPDDPTIGKHSHLAGRRYGAECFNFLKRPGGRLEGYRPPGGTERTNITRLGARHDASKISSVWVVWVAREPATGVHLIVGWYRNAIVYREAIASDLTADGESFCYSVAAKAKNATLLPPAARSFIVGSSLKNPGNGFGRKPTWYGSEVVDARVKKYIWDWDFGKHHEDQRSDTLPPRNHDPELRRKVERAAVDHAISYYKTKFGERCRIVSVESQSKGWDLEVFHEAAPLLVEVKGLQDKKLRCELTPNEYANMQKEGQRDRYVVYVVMNALAQHPNIPVASIFNYVKDGRWQTDDGRDLVIEEKVGAILSCVNG